MPLTMMNQGAPTPFLLRYMWISGACGGATPTSGLAQPLPARRYCASADYVVFMVNWLLQVLQDIHLQLLLNFLLDQTRSLRHAKE